MENFQAETFITDRIPHRPPFLWLDRVLELTADSIRAEKTISPDLDIFQGHYPDYPLMPGVLLCESVFQAGALLIGHLQDGETAPQERLTGGMPVLARILGAKFKREVRPGDTIELHVRLKERLGPAWILKGSVLVHGLVAVQVEFSCVLKATGQVTMTDEAESK
ncbi:3-hydroxyacyl-[acyl-carrier-protein] dehydratase FabZ [bacterium BMS3Bbin14]|nr:3-hydroxyacyl-[acyl-carrier-protein] dehydratase FabZ [bacterium BMS3Abin13]GBE52335.1 3-hydroxyacyl-[acyl-carrier-protein] dehydratase FabZ [bacterium BMS3Bbin14]HDK43394.1 beta-hydroxyacyl-ACP dehydratase [Desulfobacteraceae bacterium]HDO31146.1 beta-hydroxyacyl-ACP dehydratase [Desulfobacteraceae bacterium]